MANWTDREQNDWKAGLGHLEIHVSNIVACDMSREGYPSFAEILIAQFEHENHMCCVDHGHHYRLCHCKISNCT